MFGMWDAWDVEYLGYEMLGMWDVQDLGYSVCAIIRMCNVRDVECGMWNVCWNVDMFIYKMPVTWLG